MTSETIPVFDASAPLYQNIGLLKVAETAAGRHGDRVVIRASETRDLHLLSGLDSLAYWRGHQGHFQTDLGEIASNAAITRMLLGEELEDPRWSEVWMRTAGRLARIAPLLDRWLDEAVVEATRALVAEIAAIADSGASLDLRDLCRSWSIRAVCPALFGRSLDDEEIAQGIADVEGFYFAMSTKDAAETRHPETMPEFLAARGFLDRVISAALENARPGDETLIASIAEVVPAEASREERIALLRPTVGRMITEKLNIGGLSLLWTLSHLAQDPALAAEVAAEIEGRDPYALPDAETPLAASVVHEGLRLYPELPFIYRITSCEVPLGEARVPAGATVVFAPWLVQRDPRWWDEPSEFRGRRFLDVDAHREHYFPFGVGPRIRTRARFILHQLTVAVRATCAAYEPRLASDCPPGSLRPLLRSALIPRGAVKVSFARRRSALAS